MNVRKANVFASLILGGLYFATTGPALALSMKECSAKYKAAQAAGTLNGQKWNDFRKAQCGSDAAPATTAETPATTAPSAVPPTTVPAAPPATATKEPAGATPAAAAPAPAASDVIYPSAVDQKYAGEAPGKARMHTCLDQYNANKASGGNGALKWIQKGGGYFSECSKRLKGAP